MAPFSLYQVKPSVKHLLDIHGLESVQIDTTNLCGAP